jgi:site-specific DNA-cytosine methylase
VTRPRLLDLFSGAGGAAMGYHRAGFDVVGVDLNPKVGKHYPFEFHQGDALEYLAEHGAEFDAIHASPPCQAYSVTASCTPPNYPRLIAAARALLTEAGTPWVIENVEGARHDMTSSTPRAAVRLVVRPRRAPTPAVRDVVADRLRPTVRPLPATGARST